MDFRFRSVAAWMCCCVLGIGSACGEDHLWSGAANSDFFDAGNWDTNLTPSGPLELAVIDEGDNLPTVIDATVGMIELGGFQLGTDGPTGGQVIQNGGTLVIASENLSATPTFYEFKSHIGDRGSLDSSWIMNNDATILYDVPIVSGGTGFDTDGLNSFDLEIGARSGAGGAKGVLELHDNALLRISDDLKIGDEDDGNGEVYVDGDAQITVGSGISVSKGILSIAGNGIVVTGNSAGPGMSETGRTNEGYLTLSTDDGVTSTVSISDNAKLYARTLQQRAGTTNVTVEDSGEFHVFDAFNFAEPELGVATIAGAASGPQRTSNVGQNPSSEIVIALSDDAVMTVDSDLEDSGWSGLTLSGGTNRGANSGGGSSTVEVADRARFAIQQNLNMTLGTDAEAKSTLKVVGPDAIVSINGDLRMAIDEMGFENPGSATLHAAITDSSHATIQVGGDAEIGNGNLVVELDNYVPVGNETYTIVSAGGELFGGFLSVDLSLAPLPEGMTWNVDYSTTSVVLQIEGGVSQVCGDFDMDGDVDTADRTIQTQNWTGALPAGEGTATFEQGDCDGDGDVDTADQTGLIQNWTGAQQQAGNLEDTGNADLIYNPETGNVTLDASDTNSGVFISFVLGTNENNMRPENFTTSDNGSAGPFIDVGTNTDAKTFQIGQTDPINQGAGPLVNLGDILPAGIANVEALAEYLSLAEYASELGSGGSLDLMFVPEPSSLVLAMVGLLALSLRRRSD